MKEFWKEYKISQILVSLVMAVIVWAFAINELNPSKVRDFAAIPVNFVGTETFEEQNLAVISGLDSTVRVYVEGNFKTFTELDPQDITVTADLSSYNAPGSYQVPSSKINVNVPVSGLKVSSYSPRTIDIVIDRIVSREFPISAQITGVPAAGYRYRSPELSLENIVVVGPESILDQINEVQVNIEANSLSESMVYTAPIVFVDSEQNVIQSEFLEPEVDEIDVTIRITKEGEIPLRVDLIPSDTLDSDDVSISINPDVISVHADQSILANYTALTLGQIDLSTLSLSGVYTLPINVPARLSPIGDMPEIAEVTVEVKDQQVKSFVITEFELTDVAQNPANMEIQTQSVTVTMTGARKFVESLTADDFSISLSYDSSVLGMGEHELQATISVEPVGNYELSSDTVPLRIVLAEMDVQEDET